MSDSHNDERISANVTHPKDEPIEISEPSASTSAMDAEASGTGPSDVQSAEGDEVDPTTSELKANQLRSVEDLIRFAYQQNGKRLSLPGGVVREIAKGAQLEDDAAEPLFALVVGLLDKDPMLAVPPRVLAFAASARPAIHLRRRLEKAMVVALRHHTLFDTLRLRGALDGPPNDFESILDELRESVDRIMPERLGVKGETLKPSHRTKLYVNATISLTLLLALRDEWKVDRVADVLYRRLWRDSLDSADRLASIGAMADARDAAALAVLGRVFDRQRRDSERLALEAQNEAEHARRRAMDADSELASRDDKIRLLEQQLVDLAREIDVLHESLAAAERTRVHDRSHHVDDYEALRTRIVRVLDKQIELLSDGLHALREGATEVTEEFTDRTIAALGRELAQLRGQGGDT